jgi:hypothetical protein
MAEMAAMTLRERWADWNRRRFTAGSRSHASVWEKSKESRETRSNVAGGRQLRRAGATTVRPR